VLIKVQQESPLRHGRGARSSGGGLCLTRERRAREAPHAQRLLQHRNGEVSIQGNVAAAFRGEGAQLCGVTQLGHHKPLLLVQAQRNLRQLLLIEERSLHSGRRLRERSSGRGGWAPPQGPV
jgi:hypothetical protein